MDIDIWADTDGVLDWLEEYVERRGLKPPTLASGYMPSPESNRVYLVMFETAIEMAQCTERQENASD